MDPVELREAAESEREAVFLMGRDAWGGDTSAERYVAECARSPKYARGRWLVLAAGGELLSALIVYDLGPGAAGLGSVATPPERRGRGHASRLVTLAVAALEAEGKRRVFLHSDVGTAFYERLGFVALPARHQRKPGSACMARAKDLDALLADPGFAAPDYF
jgi:predicted N-acetyltransferase YhbS